MSNGRQAESHDLILGWREWLSLPGLGIPRIKAKVDTGARTSALHAFELQEFECDGIPWIRFLIHPEQYRTDVVIECTTPIKARRVVTDSGGHREERVVIETLVALPGQRWTTEMTLTGRDDMRFRMLLGRSAIRGRALVDPARSYLTRKRNPADARSKNA